MLYVLIMYCTGLCVPTLPPPSVFLFTSQAACDAAKLQGNAASNPLPNVPNIKMKQTCSAVAPADKLLSHPATP
jgi:hypothetical protein